MPKKIRTKRIRRNKFKKSRRRNLKGGNNDKVKCSMCEKMVNKDDTLIPRECLVKYGKSAHRICQNCWWNPETGFALEHARHNCPGCEKGLPLTHYKKEQPVLIDLTED